MSAIALAEVRDRGGEMRAVTDGGGQRPVRHHLLCDGRGALRDVAPEDAVAVLCAVCRPAAVAARERADRLAAIGAPRRPVVARG